MRSFRLLAITVFALALAAGAAQDFIVGGLRNGITHSLVIGGTGFLVAVLSLSAVSLLFRRSPTAPKLASIAGVLALAFHAYAALPFERTLGYFAILTGIMLGALLLWEGAGSRRVAQTIVPGGRTAI